MADEERVRFFTRGHVLYLELAEGMLLELPTGIYEMNGTKPVRTSDRERTRKDTETWLSYNYRDDPQKKHIDQLMRLYEELGYGDAIPEHNMTRLHAGCVEHSITVEDLFDSLQHNIVTDK